MLKVASVAGVLMVVPCLVAPKPALAMDPACAPLKSAMEAQRNRPFHMYMTQQRSFARANMTKAAATIGVAGSKNSEEISTGKDIYVLHDGKWIDMQTSFADMEKDKDADPDTKKAMESATCKQLPDETMYGQPSSVFVRNTPAIGIQTKLWISKSTHLPVRADITSDQGALKTVSSSRFEFGNVKAPAGAMTMKDMMKARSGR